jgi:putative chitinase
MELTFHHLRQIMPNAKAQNITWFLEDFNRFRWLHKMTEPEEIAAFISQIAKETNELLWWEELATGEAYEGRTDLGNIMPGWGVLYKGRGYLQLTGRFNYIAFNKWYNKNFVVPEDFTNNPDRIADEHELCMLVSIFYWKTRGLDKPEIYKDCKRTTKKVNGGYNGYGDRLIYFNRAKKVLLAA